MADIVKTITPSLVTPIPVDGASRSNYPAPAGEAIAAGDAIYMKSDGKYWRSIGTTLNAAAAKCDGFAMKAYAVGQVVTAYFNVEMAYGPANMTIGQRLFVGAAAGALADAATTGGTGAVAVVIANKANNSIIAVWRSTY
jgi:hypothetical protein